MLWVTTPALQKLRVSLLLDDLQTLGNKSQHSHKRLDEIPVECVHKQSNREQQGVDQLNA
jgi:hypothetical protein